MTNDEMTNDLTTNDRELDLWREQWSNVAPLPPEFQRQVQKRIKVQRRRFWLSNLLAVAGVVLMLILAVYQLSHQASRLEKGRATGLCVLVFVAVTCRLWFMRGTWRAETQSIRAFVELWHRRVLSQIRRLQISIYLAIGWIVFCAALAAANWATIRPPTPGRQAKPKDGNTPSIATASVMATALVMETASVCKKWSAA